MNSLLIPYDLITTVLDHFSVILQKGILCKIELTSVSSAHETVRIITKIR